MSQGCALWMSESKCQRSRSQCSDYWKWFLAHNCFPFTSAIIKLHAQIPCESMICLTDIGVKNLRSLNWLPRGVFVPLGQPHSSFTWINLSIKFSNYRRMSQKIYSINCGHDGHVYKTNIRRFLHSFDSHCHDGPFSWSIKFSVD